MHIWCRTNYSYWWKQCKCPTLKLNYKRREQSWRCMARPQKSRYASLRKTVKAALLPLKYHSILIEVDYVEPNHSFIMKHQGAYKLEHVICTTLPACDRATRRLLISHFALTHNLATATLWLLFKLARTQGSTFPVNIKSWHNSLKQAWQHMRKITHEMNDRQSFDFKCKLI